MAKSEARQEQTLIAKGEATGLFGQIRGDGLASALATIEQGFGDELFYPNIASRAWTCFSTLLRHYEPAACY